MLPRIIANSEPFAGHRRRASWMSEDGGSLEAEAEARRALQGHHIIARGQRPRRLTQLRHGEAVFELFSPSAIR